MNTQFLTRQPLPSDKNKNAKIQIPSHKKQYSFTRGDQSEEELSPIKHFTVNTSLNDTLFPKQTKHNLQNQNINLKLADFKRYLHQSKAVNNPEKNQANRPNKRMASFNDVQIKKKLQSKIDEAFQKLQGLKQTVKKHQRVKAEIIARSDIRRSSVRVSISE